MSTMRLARAFAIAANAWPSVSVTDTSRTPDVPTGVTVTTLFASMSSTERFTLACLSAAASTLGLVAKPWPVSPREVES